MKHYATPAALLGLAAACLSSCADQKETPEPLPEPTATYRRTWAYLDQALPARRDSTYQTAALAPTAEQNATSLFVFLRTKPNEEGLLFSINRNRLTPGLTGTYTYRTPLDFTTTDVDLKYYVFYKRTINSSASWDYGSFVNRQLTGSFTITAYDAKRQLLSGKFDARVPNASDPTDTDNTPNPRRCEITLAGSFANLSITARQ